jgi:hypothetical protein
MEGTRKPKEKIRNPECFAPEGPKWGMEYYFVCLFKKDSPFLDRKFKFGRVIDELPTLRGKT